MALVVTELATNLVKHAGGGELLLRGQSRGRAPGSRSWRSTAGRAWPTSAAACRDGYSTGGLAGDGASGRSRRPGHALRHLLRRRAGHGRCVARAAGARRSRASGRGRPCDRGGLASPMRRGGRSAATPGRVAASSERPARGPAWSTGWATGPPARRRRAGGRASASARTPARPRRTPRSRRTRRCASTRGAAVAVARVRRPDRGRSRSAGVGNIVGRRPGPRTQRAQEPGVAQRHRGARGRARSRSSPIPGRAGRPAGHALRRAGRPLAASTATPGWRQATPGLIAGVLYRDFPAARDDVTVLAVRDRRRPP